MGFTYTEAYMLPIWQRYWFIKRVSKEIESSGDTKAAHANSAEARALTGKHRSNPPAKLRRFN
jgi:hypothetical protein